MKKFILIGVISALLIIGFVKTPELVEAYLPKSSITKLSTTNYVDSVTATGEVLKKDSKIVKSDMPMIVSKVLVKSGDQVSVGQTLLTVDQNATAKKMMELNQYSDFAGLSAASAVTSYDDILAMIPKEVVSDIAGTIEAISVTDGKFVSKDDTILTLIGSDGLIVNTQISENYISKIAVGQPVIITGSGFSEKKYNGIVDEISSVATKQFIGTAEDTVVNVKIKITDADKAIRVGYSAKAKIFTSQQKNINVVPYEAVMQDDKKNEYVYVFNNGVAVKKPIQTGMELSNGVEVIQGVTPNDKILTSPAKIKNGDFVKIVKD